MSTSNLELNQQEPQLLQDTSPQAIEQAVAQPVVEEVVEAPPPKPTRVRSARKKRVVPQVSGKFLGDEDLRAIASFNREMTRRLGIKPNTSRIV